MNTGSIGPTIVVAIPLKTNPKKSTVSKAVRLLLVRSGIATEVVVDMLANHSEGARRHRQLCVERTSLTPHSKIRVRSSAKLCERLSMINVGLIGFGLAGRSFHAPVIHAVPGLKLAAIVPRTGSEAAHLYPDARIVRSVEDLLAISDIRLAVIATPNDTHHRIAQQCLAAGRDVVVDKPLAPTLEEAVDLVKFAEQRKRILSVYHNRRYDGDFQAVLQLIERGSLGRVVRFESNYDRFRPQRKANAWRERPR